MRRKRLLHQHRIEKLLVVDDRFELKGLITVKDIEKKIQYPNACKDERGRLARRRGGGRGRRLGRAGRSVWCEPASILIAVDTAHGHSKNVLDVDRPDSPALSGSGISPAATSPPPKEPRR